MFCVNRLCVGLLNTSLTCYAVVSLLYCLPPVVCVDVFSDECAALSSMSLHQPFIRAHLCCLWTNVLSPLHLSPSIPCFHSPLPLSVSYQVQTHTHTHTTGLSSSWHSDLFISCGFRFHLSQPLILPLILLFLLSLL